LRAVTILSSPVENTASGIGTQKWLGVVEVERKISSTTTAIKSRICSGMKNWKKRESTDWQVKKPYVTFR